MATMTRAASSASIFDDPRDVVHGSLFSIFPPEDYTVFYHHRKNRFQELVRNRCEYLDSLRTLRNDWISGKSTSPNTEVIEYSKKILIDFSSWLSTKSNLPSNPKLVMGPIPTGGIGIEFIVDNKFKIFLNIYNDSRVELEAHSVPQDMYFEILTRGNSIEVLLKQLYDHLSNM